MKKENSVRRATDKKREAKVKAKAKSFAQADKKREKKAQFHKKKALDKAAQGHDAGDYTPVKNSANMEKAYKLLAAQLDISNAQAKGMIDRGLVYVGNKKVMIARGELHKESVFTVQQVEKIRPIFENDDLVVVDKPAFMNADEIERQFKGAQLLHRLDRETSGVLMLVKNEEFRQKAIEAFRNDEVYKEYVAWVEGIMSESFDIDKPILTEKRNNRAVSKISKKGRPARSEVFPLEVSGKKTKVKVLIHEGRTHQIRVHLRSIDYPIVGDELYGGHRYKRVMLHAKKVQLLGMTFEAPEPKLFAHLGS